ncbi:MAG: hypothetical protein RBR82_16265 [Pseudomonas sp.]|nr:hypothetical protein [Pseudomonas sp.]
MSMPLTPELDVHIDADLRSALLGLAEIIMENEDAKQQQWQEIVRLGEGVENDRLSCRLTVV